MAFPFLARLILLLNVAVLAPFCYVLLADLDLLFSEQYGIFTLAAPISPNLRTCALFYGSEMSGLELAILQSLFNLEAAKVEPAMCSPGWAHAQHALCMLWVASGGPAGMGATPAC